jgi:peptide deformylase
MISCQYEGWEARVFQHEYDHLDGCLYIDRLDEEDRAKVQSILDSLVDNHKKAFPGLPPAL